VKFLVKPPFECPECSRPFDLVRSLNRHRMKYHTIHDRKFCPRCLLEKPGSEFGRRRDAEQKETLRGPCLECESQERYGTPERREHFRRLNYFSRMRRQWGLEREQLEEMFEAQGRACAICETSAEWVGDLNLDHVHGTEGIRGLLCTSCNVAIGIMEDNAERLRSAAAYVEAGLAVQALRVATDIERVGWKVPVKNHGGRRGPARKPREVTLPVARR
jgi:RNase P subunit RPR2